MRKTDKKDMVAADTVTTRYGTHRVVFKRDVRGFVVVAPDLSGVVTWGKTITHAKEMAREAIELCIECLVEERQTHTSRRTSPASSHRRIAVPA
ncbi:MAG: type II toxin-antitoxin system HicB family antitoxin [Patescibacteria group bacterium]